MDKDNVIIAHTLHPPTHIQGEGRRNRERLFSMKKEGNGIICENIDESGHYVK
jgi:hypothetical protein